MDRRKKELEKGKFHSDDLPCRRVSLIHNLQCVLMYYACALAFPLFGYICYTCIPYTNLLVHTDIQRTRKRKTTVTES